MALPQDRKKLGSLPVRGAWIEISVERLSVAAMIVAPCEGSVD